jgi:hypothetical protein
MWGQPPSAVQPRSGAHSSSSMKAVRQRYTRQKNDRQDTRQKNESRGDASRGHENQGHENWGDEKKVGLARALSKLGYCSRSQAAEMIRAGRVKLNGSV